MNFARTISFSLPVALLLCGCSSLKFSNLATHNARPVATYLPGNFSGAAALPADVRRVVLLPLDRDGHATPEIAREADAILLAALQRETRFEVVYLSRARCRRMFGSESFNSTAALPHGFTAQVAREFAADAVLFVDLTAHRSQRPLMIGLRAKLSTVEEDRLIWVFDEVIDASSPAVAAAVQEHFRDPAAPVPMGEAALRSPGRFATFAATAMFSTLPER